MEDLHLRDVCWQKVTCRLAIRVFSRQIGDFGAARWARSAENSTCLATYSTNAGQSTQISFAWTAPEVKWSVLFCFLCCLWVRSARGAASNVDSAKNALCAVFDSVRSKFKISACKCERADLRSSSKKNMLHR